MVLLKDLSLLLRDLKAMAREKSDIVEVLPEGEYLFYAKEKFPKSNFNFIVFNPSMNGQEAVYNLKKTPRSANLVGEYAGQWNGQEIKRFLRTWIEILEEYHSISFNEEDQFEKQYEKEFYEDFKIVDEDAKTTTFGFSQQLLLQNYIEKSIHLLEKQTLDLTEEEKKELLADAKQIQEKLPIESKDQIIKRNSKFWAKARKKSLNVCKFLITEFVKEVLKEGAKAGFHFAQQNLPHYVETIRGLIA